MASQPVAGGQWTYIGTVGSVALTDRADARVYRAIIWGTYVGTIVIHDAATAAGTTATTPIGTLGLPATSVAGAVEMDFRVRQGLVYISTGTPNITLVWD